VSLRLRGEEFLGKTCIVTWHVTLVTAAAGRLQDNEIKEVIGNLTGLAILQLLSYRQALLTGGLNR